MIGIITTAGRRLGALLTLPAAVAHEATHAIAALPWSERLVLVVEPTAFDAAVGVDFCDDTPRWARVLVGWAPFGLGMLAGVLALAHIAVAGLPAGQDLAWAGILGCWWAIYVAPSADDRAAGARGAGDDDREES